MSRTKFGNESAHLTKWIPVGEIDVDPAIQRPLNVAWAEKIGRELDPDLIGVIHVSKRQSGRYVVIDGQHRMYGVKHVFGNNGTMVECKVYEGLTKAQEAEFFVGLNNFRRPTRIDVFLKSVVAKDPDSLNINGVVNSLGFRIDRMKADGIITAIGAVIEVFYGFSDMRDPSLNDESKKNAARPELLRATLNLIRTAWGGTADSVNGHIIGGIGRLLLARGRAINTDDLRQKLAAYPGGPLAIVGAAQGRRPSMGGRVDVNVAEVCLDLYNKGRRVGKIEPLR